MRFLKLLMAALALMIMGNESTLALVAHGYSGVFTLDTVTSVDDGSGELPNATVLSAIYPNPFNPSTTIVFELAKASRVDLAVFDVRSRLVATIASGSMTGGRYQAVWDGRDRDGRPVPSGTYFCRLVADQVIRTTKLTLAK